jgi:hypothetical protein
MPRAAKYSAAGRIGGTDFRTGLRLYVVIGGGEDVAVMAASSQHLKCNG